VRRHAFCYAPTKSTHMAFKEKIQKIAERYNELKDSIKSEESTKISLILPFIRALGYDDGDPREVLPEGVCDSGNSRKADFLIHLSEGTRMIPVMVWEGKKQCGAPFTKKDHEQLGRYFPHTDARVGVLSNGILYRFYTDLVKENRLDDKPFLEFDITKINDSNCALLENLSKSFFDIELIRTNENEKRKIESIKEILSDIVEEPPYWFVKEIINDSGIVISRSPKDRDAATKWVKYSFALLMQEAVSDRISTTDGQMTVSASSNNKDQIRDEIFRQWNENLSADLRMVFTALEEYTQSLSSSVDSWNRVAYKTYSSRKRLFMSMGYVKKKILLFLHLDPKKVAIEEGFTRDVSDIGHVGVGDVEVSLSNLADLNKAKPLIKEAYEAIGK